MDYPGIMAGCDSSSILDSAGTAFLDYSQRSNADFRPQLIYNDYRKPVKVITEIQRQLDNCVEFWFSVAFINRSGITPLLDNLLDFKNRGGKGHIITTDYLSFTDPYALRKLLAFGNIDARVAADIDFHTKGYCFLDSNGVYTTLIGSSNLTQGALTSNREWNVKTTSLEKGEFTRGFIEAFECLWSESVPLSESWIEAYEKRYQEALRERPRTQRILNYAIEPNKMQQMALDKLRALRDEGKNRALIVAATGTGKTYLSAFDVRSFRPRHMLFIVHREVILTDAIDSFRDVLGENIKVARLSGSASSADRNNYLSAQYLFAMQQTISRPECYQRFAPDYFDYIIIDEAHHIGSDTYQRILGYFKPRFLLGMSATPDRTDRFNVYDEFDYNLACDIRLSNAMEYDLLCPFHYFGVTDVEVDGHEIDENTAVARLTCDERVRHIIEKARFYGHSGERVKGLIFCSRVEEAKELSSRLNENGLRTCDLSGADTEDEREAAIERLESDINNPDPLDYILTVDILNEGVDIPAVNQIIMLRPTQSSIVFIQQLGRGLRKHNGKDYVVVIDFIGNYKNSFMIPIALSGDNTYSKDALRRFTTEGTLVIPGSSTISFDRIARERIYRTIDNQNFHESRLLKNEYQNLKYRLGRIPSLQDFDDNNAIDPMNLIGYSGSYYSYLVKYEPEYRTRISRANELMLGFVESNLANGKQRYPLLLLDHVLKNREFNYRVGESDCPVEADEKSLISALNYLSLEFRKPIRKASDPEVEPVLTHEDDVYYLNSRFTESLEDESYESLLENAVAYGIRRSERQGGDCYKGTNLILNNLYSYTEACELLNWNKDLSSVIGGYMYNEYSDSFCVFINYDKAEDAINYEDKFLDRSHIKAISKKNRNKSSKDYAVIYGRDEHGARIEKFSNTRKYLFIRKNKDANGESKEFFFLGEIRPVGDARFTTLPGTGERIFEIEYELETPVREDIYDYLNSDA